MLPRREVPPEARQAALTLIGWLARRSPQEPPDGKTTQRCGPDGHESVAGGPPLAAKPPDRAR